MSEQPGTAYAIKHFTPFTREGDVLDERHGCTRPVPSQPEARALADSLMERAEFTETARPGATVAAGEWADVTGPGHAVAERTVTVTTASTPTRTGTTTTITQRILALPTTGAADGTTTALDFVQRYLDKVATHARRGHEVESVACAVVSPRGKHTSITCLPCEAQRLLTEAGR